MQHPLPTAGKNKTRRLTMTALMTAVFCVLAPFSIPIGPVPLSLTTLALYASLYLLGWKRTTVSLLAYLLIGLIGLPVFSGFAGGPGKLLGPTGGYLIGFLPMAILAGQGIARTRSRLLQLAAMALGTAVCYAFGTAWFCVSMGSGAGAALAVCVVPFLPGDLLKILLALSVCPALQKRLPPL